jgi:hypothetical protein
MNELMVFNTVEEAMQAGPPSERSQLFCVTRPDGSVVYAWAGHNATAGWQVARKEGWRAELQGKNRSGRDLEPGSVFERDYKGIRYRLEVLTDGWWLSGGDFGDGKLFPSPTQAGNAIVGPGKAVNGRLWWGLPKQPTRYERENADLRRELEELRRREAVMAKEAARDEAPRVKKGKRGKTHSAR